MLLGLEEEVEVEDHEEEEEEEVVGGEEEVEEEEEGDAVPPWTRSSQRSIDFNTGAVASETDLERTGAAMLRKGFVNPTMSTRGGSGNRSANGRDRAHWINY
jgi:hypothetical protein